MNLTALPAFTDNYNWMLDDGHQALVVDPGDSAPVVAALAARQLVLATILVTHHHADHVGGVDALLPHLQGPVYGPKRERIPQPFMPSAHGEHVDVMRLRLEVIGVPGHTSGPIAYFTAAARDGPALFCGDTLFSGGCGRRFDGTPAPMHHSPSLWAERPGGTRARCAHGCTLSNLKFARAVEPESVELAASMAWCESRRASGLPTWPSSITWARQTNPFLSCGDPAVANIAREHGAPSRDVVAVLATPRK